jgi:hypothetical protein
VDFIKLSCSVGSCDFAQLVIYPEMQVTDLDFSHVVPESDNPTIFVYLLLAPTSLI